MNHFLQLHSNVIPVKGFLRSVICDLEREYFSFIPNSLFYILNEQIESRSLEQLRIDYKEDLDTFDEYINYLIDKEFCFIIPEGDKELFPKMNLEYDEPNIISNSIICYGDDSFYDLKKVVLQLESVGCEHLEIRFFGAQSKTKFLKLILDSVSKSIILAVDVYLKYSEDEFDDILKMSNNPRINQIVLWDSSKSKREGKLYYYNKKIDDNSHCGAISMGYFTVNVKTFTESHNSNSCLHKKISISQNGDIKNCPSMLDTYGNINTTSITEVIHNANFRRYDKIKKDDILICQDCEFRHVCTDCRAFIDDQSNLYSHPLKCNYNPYIGKWKGDFGYRSFKQCGISIEGNTIKIDQDTLDKVNAEIWQE